MLQLDDRFAWFCHHETIASWTSFHGLPAYTVRSLLQVGPLVQITDLSQQCCDRVAVGLMRPRRNPGATLRAWQFILLVRANSKGAGFDGIEGFNR